MRAQKRKGRFCIFQPRTKHLSFLAAVVRPDPCHRSVIFRLCSHQNSCCNRVRVAYRLLPVLQRCHHKFRGSITSCGLDAQVSGPLDRVPSFALRVVRKQPCLLRHTVLAAAVACSRRCRRQLLLLLLLLLLILWGWLHKRRNGVLASTQLDEALRCLRAGGKRRPCHDHVQPVVLTDNAGHRPNPCHWCPERCHFAQGRHRLLRVCSELNRDVPGRSIRRCASRSRCKRQDLGCRLHVVQREVKAWHGDWACVLDLRVRCLVAAAAAAPAPADAVCKDGIVGRASAGAFADGGDPARVDEDTKADVLRKVN